MVTIEQIGKKKPDTTALEFRVSRPGMPTRRLRLKGLRYTFGSGTECSVRLDDPELLSCHAELVRGDGRILLRFHEDLANHAESETAEKTLRPGDTFFLGSFQFEFVGEEAITSSASSRTDGLESVGSGQPPRLSFASGMRFVTEGEQSTKSGLESSSRSPVEKSLDSVQEVLRSEAFGVDLHEGVPRRPRTPEFPTDMRSQLEHAHQQELADVLWRFQQAQRQAARASETVEHMRSQVVQLTDRLDQTNDLARQHSREIDQLRHEREKTVSQLRDALQQSQEYHDCLERTREDRDQLAQQVRELSRRHAVEGEQASANHQLISDQLAQAVSEAEKHSKDLEVSRQEHQSISKQLIDLSAKLEAAEQELKQTQSLNDEISVQREQALQQVEQLSQRYDQTVEQLEKMSEECRAITAQKSQLDQQLQQRTEERDAATDMVRQHANKLSSQETLTKQLQGQVSQLEYAVAESRRETELLQTEYQAACEAVTKIDLQLQNTEQDRSRDLAIWNAKSAELHGAIDRISVDLEAAAGDVSQRAQSVDELQFELSRTREALAHAETEKELRPTIDEMIILRQRLLSTEKQLSQLQEEYEVSTHQLSVQSQNLEIDRSAASQVQALAADREALNGEVVAVRQKLIETEQQLVNLQHEHETSQQQLKEQSEQLAILSASAASSPMVTPDPNNTTGGSETSVGYETNPEQQAEAPVQYEETIEAESPREVPAWNDLPPSYQEDEDSIATATNMLGIKTPEGDAGHTESLQEEGVSKSFEEPSTSRETGDTSRSNEFTQTGSPWKPTHQNETPSNAQNGAANANDSWNTSQTMDGLQGIDGNDFSPEEPRDPVANLERSDAQLGSLASDLLKELSDHPTTTPESFDENKAWNADQGDGSSPWASAHGVEDTGEDPSTTFAAAAELYRDSETSDAIPYSEHEDVDESSVDDESMRSIQSYIASQEDNPIVSQEVVTEPPPPEPAVQTEPSKAGSGAEGEDESIEDYMNRLLQRVSGDSDATVPVVPRSSPASQPEPPSAERAVPTAAPEPEPTKVAPEEPYLPRSQAPEKTSNLAAMRELANSSARTAIISSVHKQSHGMVIRNFTIAAIAAVVSLALFIYSGLEDLVPLGIATLTAILACVYGFEGLKLYLELQRHKGTQEVAEVSEGSGDSPPQEK